MSKFPEFEKITSRDNAKVKLFASLSQTKYRNQNRLFLAEGVKLSLEAVNSGIAGYILVSENGLKKDIVADAVEAVADKVETILLSDPAFEKISTESAPQGMIAVAEFSEIHSVQNENTAKDIEGKKVLALDGIRDPGNLGTIMRTALAMRYDCLLLSDCADIYNPKTVRASMGAVFNLNTVTCSDMPGLFNELSKKRRILGAALTDNSLTFGECELCSSDIAVIGNEGHGISEAVLDSCTDFVKIPMNEKSESLNAAMAACIISWEYSKLSGNK